MLTVLRVKSGVSDGGFDFDFLFFSVFFFVLLWDAPSGSCDTMVACFWDHRPTIECIDRPIGFEYLRSTNQRVDQPIIQSIYQWLGFICRSRVWKPPGTPKNGFAVTALRRNLFFRGWSI